MLSTICARIFVYSVYFFIHHYIPLPKSYEMNISNHMFFHSLVIQVFMRQSVLYLLNTKLPFSKCNVLCMLSHILGSLVCSDCLPFSALLGKSSPNAWNIISGQRIYNIAQYLKLSCMWCKSLLLLYISTISPKTSLA